MVREDIFLSKVSAWDVQFGSGLHAFEDAQSAEVWQSDLQLADSLCSCDVVLSLACRALLFDPAHICLGRRSRLSQVSALRKSNVHAPTLKKFPNYFCGAELVSFKP